MSTTTNLNILKINKLSKDQYEDALTKADFDNNAIYLTPDDDGSSVENYVYTHNGNARYTVGGLTTAVNFEQGMTIKQILDKIFFPFTAIVVDTTSADALKMFDSSNNVLFLSNSLIFSS